MSAFGEFLPPAIAYSLKIDLILKLLCSCFGGFFGALRCIGWLHDAKHASLLQTVKNGFFRHNPEVRHQRGSIEVAKMP